MKTNHLTDRQAKATKKGIVDDTESNLYTDTHTHTHHTNTHTQSHKYTYISTTCPDHEICLCFGSRKNVGTNQKNAMSARAVECIKMQSISISNLLPYATLHLALPLSFHV